MIEEVKKNHQSFKLSPHLEDYDSTYRKFKWQDHHQDIPWFSNHKINAAYVACDQHLTSFRKNKIALYYETEDGQTSKYTFSELAFISNQYANFLKDLDIERGERVFIFLPRIPQLYFAFLGILKTSAIAGTLFSAFQEKALLDRLENSGAKILFTTSELKVRVDKVRHKLPELKHVIVVDSEEFKKKIANYSTETHIAQMDPDEPAFMLYTSGTTGKPKGVIHQHLAILQEYLTAKWVLDLHEEDTYWCTADPGWVTGIAYEILGSWANGVAAIVYGGRFDTDRWYQILEKYKVTVWYTAPTAVRMLMSKGVEIVHKYDLSNLRLLASVGEPLNPEAIRFGLKAYKLPFHDNWWQTECGAICIANYPCLDIKLGSMGKPFPGVEAAIVSDSGKVLPDKQIGNLCLKPGWPSMMAKIWMRPTKYQSYFKHGWYYSGDLAYKDKNGYFWFVGRADDVIKTSGERVGPFEVESSLVEHRAVAEAGVIGKPDPLRGEIIKAFVALKPGFNPSEKLKEEIAEHVKRHLAGHAYPREIEFVDKLPKTRSGKIMRRILKAKELGLPIGDTSTLEEY